MIRTTLGLKPLPRFPRRALSFGLAAMITLLITSSVLSWHVGKQIRKSLETQAQLMTATEKVEHYGNILEISIKDVVNHGDPEAASRYRRVQPLLRQVLTNLRTEVSGKAHERDAIAVDQSDLELIAMEYRALDLVAKGKLTEARRMIYSARYDYLVKVYFDGTRAIEARAARYAESVRWELNLYVSLIVAMSAASLFLVMLGWAVLILPMRRWGYQLNHARSAAEHSARLLGEKQAELEKLNHQLFDQARTDTLTGVLTRLKFNEDMAELWPRLVRNGAKACALMCDIDFFKQYNDSFGHAAGDEVLRRVAGALNHVRRDGDQLYRIGGEEFLVVLHDCTLDQAARRAEDYRATVQALAIPHSASPIGVVTISVGVARLVGGGMTSLQDCLSQADDAMYKAKARGRNGVVTSGRLAA